MGQFVIDDVVLDTAVPTELPLSALFTWVVWQVPRRQAEGQIGAVRPPTTAYGWWPAIINNKTEMVIVHAQVEQPFDSPETAVDYFN